MTQSAVLDRIETVASAIEFLVHLIDEDMRSPDEALDAACALAEQFEPSAIVGYTTIDSRRHVATFQTAVYPRLPTWPFSKVHDVPIRRPYVGTCAQAIYEGRTITCSNITTETGFDPSWRQATIPRWSPFILPHPPGVDFYLGGLPACNPVSTSQLHRACTFGH